MQTYSLQLEAQLNELTEKYQFERKLREELDRNKRRLELDMGEQKTQEQEKHSKMESMSHEMAKLEAELSQLRNKWVNHYISLLNGNASV